MYNLQKKFPSSKNIVFDSPLNKIYYTHFNKHDFEIMEKKGVLLEIIDSKNFLFEKIILNIKINNVIKLFCGPLDKIIVLDIECIHWYIN